MEQCTCPGPRLRAARALELTKTGAEVRVYLALESFADSNGTCFPSQQAIAERAGLTLRPVKAALVALRASGLVTSVQRHRNGGIVGCTYTLTTYAPSAGATETAEHVEDASQEPHENPALVAVARGRGRRLEEPTAVRRPVEVLRPGTPAVVWPHAGPAPTERQEEDPGELDVRRRLARMSLPVQEDELLPILRGLGAGNALRGFRAAEETLSVALDGARSPRAVLLHRLGQVTPYRLPAPRREWCGSCDHGFVEDGYGRMRRCHCHPRYAGAAVPVAQQVIPRQAPNASAGAAIVRELLLGKEPDDCLR
jgi:hypothetical protein